MSGFVVNTNVPAIFAQRQLTVINAALQKNMEKLSSGYRINHSSDDAAGLAISEKLQAQINGLTQAQQNIQDGISMVQVAEGGISQISGSLQRLRTLAVQGANDTLTTTDRALIQLEFNQLLDEINRQVSTTKFNTKKLLNGDYSEAGRARGTTSLVLQVGANDGKKTDTNGPEVISFFLITVTTTGLGIDKLKVSSPYSATYSKVSVIINKAFGVNGYTSTTQGVVSRKGAESAIALLDKAITEINGQLADIGALQNRLDKAFTFVQLQNENQQAAHSRLKDLDFASEIVDFTKNQVLQQTGTSALAQANVQPQSVLTLLNG